MAAAIATSAAASSTPDFGMISGLVTGLPGAIVACLRLTEFVKELKNTPTDVKTCSALTTLIAVDLKYLISLRRKTCNIAFLARNPDLAQRIDSIIASTLEGILNVGRLLEGCRQDIYKNGKVPVKARMQWVLGDRKAFAIREGNLQGVHRAVLSEIQFLRMRDTAGETVRGVVELVEHESFENVELLGMSYRQTRKKRMTVQVNEIVMGDTEELNRSKNEHKITANDKVVREQSSDAIELEAMQPRAFQFSFDPSQNSSLFVENWARSSAVSWDIRSTTTLQNDNGDNEEEDLEAAYYRDLRLQDNERQRRIEARRRQDLQGL